MGEIIGTAKSDKLTGTNGNDIIKGLAGNDQLFGKDGQDTIYGGSENDTIKGGLGNDILHGDSGNDRLYGEAGSDHLEGGTGSDFLDPGAGKNVVFGGAGNDTLLFDQNNTKEYSEYHGGDGKDTIVFTEDSPADVLGMPWGYFYVDNPASKNLVFVKDVEVFDASAASKLSYTGGKYLPATVIGTDNNDTFFGHDANETLIGGAGQDSFRPRSGSDTIVSEKNDNDLVLYDTTLDFGTDIMNGFNGEGKKGGDVIQFSHTSSPGSENHPITVSEHNGHTLFDWQVGSLLVDTTGLIKNLDYFIS